MSRKSEGLIFVAIDGRFMAMVKGMALPSVCLLGGGDERERKSVVK
jgi:hypothetical protein